MPEIMRSRSQAFLADLHKPAALRLFLHIMICCGLLEVLREDNRAVVRAASAASKASDFLLAFLPQAIDASGEGNEEAA